MSRVTEAWSALGVSDDSVLDTVGQASGLLSPWLRVEIMFGASYDAGGITLNAPAGGSAPGWPAIGKLEEACRV